MVLTINLGNTKFSGLTNQYFLSEKGRSRIIILIIIKKEKSYIDLYRYRP